RRRLPFEMKQFLAILSVSMAAAGVMGAGTVTGIVRAQGKEGAGPESSGGKYDSRKYKFAERIDYAGMRDFVVFTDGPLATNAPLHTQSVQVVTTRKTTQ